MTCCPCFHLTRSPYERIESQPAGDLGDTGDERTAALQNPLVSLTLTPMWNVEERFEKKAMDSLAALGFTVGSTRGVVRVEKYGCGAEFRQDPDGRFRMTVLPTIMLNGQFTRLWDAGYQKFLLTDEGVKIPALASHLESLRKFNEELRTALGVPTFYNEALGSVSQLSVYDRVKGRPGDVPDTTVGCHVPAGDH
jgi:hypothetical protein